jgi:hypothetical protein
MSPGDPDDPLMLEAHDQVLRVTETGDIRWSATPSISKSTRTSPLVTSGPLHDAVLFGPSMSTTLLLKLHLGEPLGGTFDSVQVRVPPKATGVGEHEREGDAGGPPVANGWSHPHFWRKA